MTPHAEPNVALLDEPSAAAPATKPKSEDLSGQPDRTDDPSPTEGEQASGQPDREATYERLKENLKQGDQLFQVVGADIEYLLGQGETFRSLAAKTGFPKSTLGDYHKAWMIAPSPDSLKVGEKTGTYSHCVVAAAAASKIKRAYRELYKDKLDDDKLKDKLSVLTRKIFEDAVTEGMDTRALRAKYERKAQKIRNKKLAKDRAAALPPADWYNRCHRADCVEVLQGLPDGSVDLVILDPPYWPYHDGQGKGGLRQASYRGTVLTGCALREEAEAKAKVLELIPLLPMKLTAEGTVLYWNTGFHCDSWEIVKAFEEAGLPNYRAGVWHKELQIVDHAVPHSCSFERWLIQRRNAKAFNSHDYSVSRTNFLTDEPLVLEDTVLPKKTAFHHLMEKPESVSEKFIRAYCPPNSLVFDAYGCSGSACCAAIKLGHRFIYCELFKQNFNYGSARIAAAQQEIMQQEKE